ncbi:MAG TPA: helix-turn-helix domain-containing protein [Candidatus Binatia bacterium]|jgi:AcrR family transcriptional regulator
MPPATASAPRVHRTQEERSATTRKALLDAAVECLIDGGYQGFHTTTVADRAGVSRGAQLHHFPSRACLVAAAVAHVFAGLTEDYRRAFAALGAGQRSPARAVGLLQASCMDPRHFAVLDLYAAARTDAELRESLVPVAAAHRDNVIGLARLYFPEAAGDERFHLTLDLLLHAMVGMAVARGLYGEDPSQGALTTLIEKLATDAASARRRRVLGSVTPRRARKTDAQEPK